ncbi:MAG: HAMP domain-containing sensor histidine kinase [Anaerocolumna aminovalerica]|jgi:signal transduction histidine kinase|uniref:sensor histidine kinase n=1 Tax=Anaerocolumna aminovalerica TaxID=1527 RepID=UPI0015964406|nr:HAMP domain-containing sensor histidine kinase [Anaerocolumna aminovalerica]MDU6266054.1 HAMP domain-containing sensor histidine kinase [Anaerocolumna aminovalerica]
MYTKEEELQLQELIKSNKEFAYFINKSDENGKLLISHFSHELRNPLTLIKSTVQLIESNHPEARDFKYWTQLNEDINELEVLLTDLSFYNNSEKISIEKQDLLLLLNSVLSAFYPQAEQRGIHLSLTVDDNDKPYFTQFPHDRIKIKQVFTNLIRNAFDATKAGNYIHIECKAYSPTHIAIAVHNNGHMIPEDEISTIFDPFVTYKAGGTGLGLAISSRIIKAHEGTMKVSSTEEKTSFLITLPL